MSLQFVGCRALCSKLRHTLLCHVRRTVATMLAAAIFVTPRRRHATVHVMFFRRRYRIRLRVCPPRIPPCHLAATPLPAWLRSLRTTPVLRQRRQRHLVTNAATSLFVIIRLVNWLVG